jgi:hypothetical protein
VQISQMQCLAEPAVDRRRSCLQHPRRGPSPLGRICLRVPVRPRCDPRWPAGRPTRLALPPPGSPERAGCGQVKSRTGSCEEPDAVIRELLTARWVGRRARELGRSGFWR